SGSAASWRTGRALALWSPRGVDPEGGAVVVEELLGHDVVADGLTGDGAQTDGGADSGQTGPLNRRNRRNCAIGKAALQAGAIGRTHVDATQTEEVGGGLGPRHADHQCPLLPRARSGAGGQERGGAPRVRGHYASRESEVNRINEDVRRMCGPGPDGQPAVAVGTDPARV